MTHLLALITAGFVGLALLVVLIRLAGWALGDSPVDDALDEATLDREIANTMYDAQPVPIHSSSARCKSRNRPAIEPDPIESYAETSLVEWRKYQRFSPLPPDVNPFTNKPISEIST